MENSSNLNNQIYELKTENLKLRKENLELKRENAALKREAKRLNVALSGANVQIKNLERKYDNYVANEEKRIEEIVSKAVNKAIKETSEKYEKIIDELNNKITKLEKRLNTNSSNSGIPTSKNRIEVKIPNNREKSDKGIGGQKGHERHKLDYFKDEEITDIVEHTLDACPDCGGKLKEINVVKSDIIDVKVTVSKTRNNIHNYQCECCKKKVTANNELPRGASYGSNVKSMALSLLNESNSALNKVSKHIAGISNNEIILSEGYLVKLQQQTADKLKSFTNELKEHILTLDKVHWDDTTVTIQSENTNNEKGNTKKGIIRFYGDDKFALLIGHNKKDEKGINEDGILPNLPSSCVCIHDHLLINYNDNYEFQNAECNEHALRYLKGVKDNLHDHTWQDKLSDLLKKLNHDRNDLLMKNISSFDDDTIKKVYAEYDEAIKLGYIENEQTPDYHFYKDKELSLVKRLDKFKDNHLLFIKDFAVDFTNNTAERGLRQCKRKLATSFLFKNINTMKDYATIISYIETCYRNGISRYDSLKRLIENNPVTVNELINSSENTS